MRARVPSLMARVGGAAALAMQPVACAGTAPPRPGGVAIAPEVVGEERPAPPTTASGPPPPAIVASAPAPSATSPGVPSCEDAVLDLVSGTTEGRELLVETESPVALELGAPPDAENPGYSVAIREHHGDHKATRGWFYVDPRVGEVRENDPGSAPLQVDPGLARRVIEACR